MANRVDQGELRNVQRRKDREGNTRYRARVKVDRRDRVGPWRRSLVEALADVEPVRKRAAPLLAGMHTTLDAALRRVCIEAELRGLPAETIREFYLSHCSFLRRCWRAETPLGAIDVQEVCWMLNEALRAGRSPNTLRKQDLMVLNQAFQFAGLASPVPEAKRKMASALRARPVLRRALSMGEIATIAEMIRIAERRQAKVEDGKQVAALILVLAGTGLRAGELGRMRVADVNLAGRMLEVPRPKDRANPRAIPIPEAIVPAFELLLAGAAEDGTVWPGGMKRLSNRLHRWSEAIQEPRLNARALRHAYATHIAHSGASIAGLQALMGHRHLSTTSRYVHATIHGTLPHVAALGEALAGSRPDPAAPPSPQR